MSEKLREKYLVFLDLETTDLDPSTALPLEVGAILADAATLEALVTFTALIQPHARAMDLMPDVVVKMHTNSYLLQDLEDDRQVRYPTLEAALRYFEDIVCTWMKARGEIPEQFAYIPGKWVTLAGHDIWFDRTFLRSYAPEFEADCHHVMVDVSSIRHMARHYAPGLVQDQDLRHRALQDCYSALDELRRYRSAVIK